jgi:hypothetical protein
MKTIHAPQGKEKYVFFLPRLKKHTERILRGLSVYCKLVIVRGPACFEIKQIPLEYHADMCDSPQHDYRL